MAHLTLRCTGLEQKYHEYAAPPSREVSRYQSDITPSKAKKLLPPKGVTPVLEGRFAMRRTNTIHDDAVPSDTVPSLEELKLHWKASIEQFRRDFAHCLVLLEKIACYASTPKHFTMRRTRRP